MGQSSQLRLSCVPSGKSRALIERTRGSERSCLWKRAALFCFLASLFGSWKSIPALPPFLFFPTAELESSKFLGKEVKCYLKARGGKKVRFLLILGLPQKRSMTKMWWMEPNLIYRLPLLAFPLPRPLSPRPLSLSLPRPRAPRWFRRDNWGRRSLEMLLSDCEPESLAASRNNFRVDSLTRRVTVKKVTWNSIVPASMPLVAAVSVTAVWGWWGTRGWTWRTRRWTPLRKYIPIVAQSVPTPASRCCSGCTSTTADWPICSPLGWNSFPTRLLDLQTIEKTKQEQQPSKSQIIMCSLCRHHIQQLAYIKCIRYIC